jgi:malate dehydrogenase (oxaloacetate-decarboxylating)(NADP+)
MTDLKQAALDYHEFPRPGKITVELSKPAETAAHLALAYSPGVAEPVREIARDPEAAYRYTGKGNLVAVITNGSAILGLGDLGPLASKPVMEGKALLFKRFAGIDSIDIEVDAESPQAFIDTVRRIAETFGGINLEDIKAPECFEIERVLIEQCNIPVFHDDQHGTAIVTAASMLNALEIQGKALANARIVCLGAGAAATACMQLLLRLGAQAGNLYMLDRSGVIHSGRPELSAFKRPFVNDGGARTLMDAMEGADVFIGLSGANLLGVAALKRMAARPVVFACSNPDPEISPEIACAARDDLIIATGRSDYPNQVNNVLGFPSIFRGALDVRARRINEAM